MQGPGHDELRSVEQWRAAKLLTELQPGAAVNKSHSTSDLAGEKGQRRLGRPAASTSRNGATAL